MGLSQGGEAPRRVRPMGALLDSVGPGSTYLKLMRRELSHRGNRRFQRTCDKEKYRHFSLQGSYDTSPAEGLAGHQMTLSFLQRRSRIVEIVAHGGLVFALAHSGACAAFSRATGGLVCFLNANEDEVIRSLFYNKQNNSLITVSVYASDNFCTLKCRSTPLECIARKELDKGVPLFTSESLKWPGFVEFDDVNAKVLTYNACDKVYKVFDLRDYRELYQIRNEKVTEIKISPGIMLLILEEEEKAPPQDPLAGAGAGAPGARDKRVPLQILNIENGEVLKTLSQEIPGGSKVDFIEQFNEKLLVKQEGAPLSIRDVRTGALVTVPLSQFVTPNAFIFLYEKARFLTFHNKSVEVWNFRGERAAAFEDHTLWHSDRTTNNIYITADQGLIISYCHAGPLAASPAVASRGGVPPPEAGAINISCILSGKCLAKIRAPPAGREGVSPTEEALTDVTAIFYDEEHNEIYSGNRNGIVSVWSNSPA